MHRLSAYVFIVSIIVVGSSVLPSSKSTRLVDADYLLPKYATPTNYDILLNLPANIFTTNRFSGNVKIALTISTNPYEIRLHAKDLEIINIELTEVTNNEIVPLAEIGTSDPDTDILIITAQQMIPQGSYNLVIEFNGEFSPKDMHGFYKSSYKNDQGEIEYLATTQFEATHARRAFPCFDEPDFKATFTLTFIYPKEYNVLANTPQQGAPVEEDENRNRVSFHPTPSMSTYLNAFLVSKFTCDRGIDIAGSIPYQVCSSSADGSDREYALTVGPKLMSALEAVTNNRYASMSIGKMDQLAIPDFSAGAMENWGLVTYRESALLWDEEESSNANKQRTATIIAHEFTHMWFGNLVTIKWWSDLFLNEGFARYYQYFATHEVETDWELDKQFVVEQVQSVLVQDSSKSSLALSADAFTPEAISNRFDGISYSKGATILRMVTHMIGLENFQNGIRRYLDINRSQNTVANDLWTIVSDFALDLPYNFIDIMENWTFQPGYPVLTVKADNNNIVITQNRFLLSGAAEPTKWYVPITYTKSTDENKFVNTIPQAWLVPTEENLVLENALNGDEWIIFNNKQTGYYRVNYDDILWGKIQTILQTNLAIIDPLNRAQIVDDLFNLARTGDVPYSRTFNIISYLQQDIDYYPWYSAFNGFTYVLSKIQDAEIRSAVINYIHTLMDKLYKSMPFVATDPSKHIYSLKQALALNWACKLGNADCIANSKTIFASYRNDGIRPNKNLRSVVYCTALRNSDNIPSDWGFLWSAFINTKIATEQTTILSALGCTTDETFLNNLLTEATTEGSEIRMQDSQSVFASVYNNNPSGIIVAFKYIATNYQRVVDYYGKESTVISLIKTLAGLFTTQTQLDELSALIASDKLSDIAKAAAEQALASAKENLEINKKFEEDLAKHFGIDKSSATSNKLGFFVLVSMILSFYLL